MNKFLLGVIVGLLVAPKSGKELRKDVCDRASDVLEDIKNFDKETAKESINNVKEAVVTMDLDTAKDLINRAGDKTKDILNDAVDAIQNNDTLRTLPNKTVDAVTGATIKTVEYIDENDLVGKTKDISKKTGKVAKDVVKKADEVKDITIEKVQNVTEQVEEFADKTVEKVKEKFEK